MYKKAMSCLLLINLLFLFSFLSIKGIGKTKEAAIPAFETKMDAALFADKESSTIGIASVATSGQRIVDCNVLEKQYLYDMPISEWEVLCRIVEAEAGGEDENGKLLVANVILNRVNSEEFPDTVSEVVFQREKGVTQFSPVSNGRYYSVEVSEETMDAVERAMKGDDISQGALYFAARKFADSERMKWFDEKLIFLFKHGGHEFFK